MIIVAPYAFEKTTEEAGILPVLTISGKGAVITRHEQ
jgi:hypothetical protein